MSENEYQPQQDRPSRTDASPTRRTTPTRRSYTTTRRSTSGSTRSQSDYNRRSTRATTTSRTQPEVQGSSESMTDGMIDSLKGAVASGRDAISNGADAISSRVSSLGGQGDSDPYSSDGEGFAQSVRDKLPDNVWVKRGIFIVIGLILILILANLVTCIAGALSGGSSGSSSAAASSSSEAASSEAASSSGAVSGVSAQAQGVASPWTADGTFTTGDSALDQYIKNVCDEHSTDGATYDKNAYDTFIYVSRTDYIERENNQSPWGPTWDVEYAKQYFEEGGSGNCYNYAAVMEYVLKYFGYSDAEAEPCVVGLESGAWGDHALIFVTDKANNGKRCLVDCALSANGWMIDADSYQYDVRNINQNSSIKGNVDVLDDENNPTRIAPGELTESSSASAESADSDASANTDTDADENTDAEEENTEEENTDEIYYEEDSEDEVYYADDTDEEGYYDEEGYTDEVYYEEDSEDEVYYDEEA